MGHITPSYMTITIWTKVWDRTFTATPPAIENHDPLTRSAVAGAKPARPEITVSNHRGYEFACSIARLTKTWVKYLALEIYLHLSLYLFSASVNWHVWRSFAWSTSTKIEK